MTNESAGKEFLELAIEIERNGYSFYEMAAPGKSKEVQAILKELAGRERQHEHTYRDMLTRAGGYLPENACVDYQYIHNLADSSIFSGRRAIELLTGRTVTDIGAVEAGIGFEKDSILLYSEARGMLSRQDQDIIDMITSEEKKHLSELMFLANRLRSGQG